MRSCYSYFPPNASSLCDLGKRRATQKNFMYAPSDLDDPDVRVVKKKWQPWLPS
jgi:hypothetical protein